MYSFRMYGQMIADRVRMKTYAKALRKVVKPGSVVLEIGTGAGAFAIFACQLGAKHVYAIESGEIIQVARENAVDNHCADRIEFIEDISAHVNISQLADIVFSDLRGAIPLLTQHIPSIVDARQRFLAPSGILIPRRDTIHAAVVEVPRVYAKMTDPWERNCLDQRLSAGRRIAINDPENVRVKPGELLTAPQVWTKLDYFTVENADVSGELDWTVKRDGTGHGILTWFETELVDGVGFSTGPGTPKGVYGSLFFPWENPVKLMRGNKVRVRLDAKLVKGNYMWRWASDVNPGATGGKASVHFDQSLLAGRMVSLEQLHKTASDHIPQLSEDGVVDRRILELMDGQATLEEIARRLANEYPERFARWYDAMDCVGAVSREYSR